MEGFRAICGLAGPSGKGVLSPARGVFERNSAGGRRTCDNIQVTMSDNRLPSAAELPHQAREAILGFKGRFHAWQAELKDDPTLLWRTPAVRIGLYLILGIALLLSVRWATHSLAGAGAGADPARKMATVFVACTNPECLKSGSARVAMDFKEWPLKCETCGQLTVYRATICKTCRNWYAVGPSGPEGCPFCRKKAEANKPTTKPKAKTANSDDAEDGWN